MSYGLRHHGERYAMIRLALLSLLGWSWTVVAEAAFPVVAATNTSVTDTPSTSHVVSLPTGIASGHLLVCLITADTNPAALTWPGGWTVLSSTLSGTDIRFETAYRNAAGTEGSTITVTSDLTVQSSHQCRRITGHDPAIAPQAGTAAALTDNSPNPPAVTPTGGAKDYLWIAFQGNDGTISVTGYPANYTDSQLLADGIATATGSATRNLNAASEDPGVFTLPAAEQWVAQTVVVHPAQTNPVLPTGTNVIFHDRFRNGLGQWTLDQTGGTISVVAPTAEATMFLHDTSASAIISATQVFVEPSVPYNVEFDATYLTGGAVVMELLDVSNNVIISIDLSAGISFDTDTTSPSTGTWAASAWKQAVLVIDPSADTVSCFISNNGTTQLDDEQIQVGTSKGYSGASITKIRFRSDTTNTGDAFVDEAKVYVPNLFSMGDSISIGKLFWSNHPGSGLRGPNQIESMPPGFRLGQLIEWSGGQWVANRGTGGARIADVTSKLSLHATQQNAKTLIISVGTNDVANGRTYAQMTADLDALVTALLAAGYTGNRVIFSNIIPDVRIDLAGEITIKNDYNAYLVTVCQTNGFTCVDADSALENPASVNVLNPPYADPDGTHLTVEGSRRLGAVWFTGLPKPSTRAAVTGRGTRGGAR